ncbi:hypothetical protein C9446_02125 [Providencia heimbachae]|uniref:hypothetical protein n=1 Tax=Providencia heimbachae TaxID=333962 RepID=UPI0010BF4529|nr:hypothetical protein [Providencia heimbachae]QCJ68775.1 hypothetical protein C9446_02125 [Providencia heimbachae]
MTRIQLSIALMLSPLISIPTSFADSDRPLFSMTMSESGVPQNNSEGGITRSSSNESRVLPIWGDEARARGYDLPEPFGASYGYMNMRQDIVVDKIGFIMPKNPETADALSIDAGHTRQKSETHTLKIDSWVFPFLNVYGLYGHTKGKSHTILNGGNLGGLPLDFILKDQPFDLDFKGKTYGAGFTLAGGYENIFTTLDLNYTRTDLDILDGNIKALIISPRIGYEFTFDPLIDGQGNTKVQIWTGAMYQDITQRFKGNVNNLDLPPTFQGFIDIFDDPGMKFDVKQHLAHKWNNTVGARVEFTRNFNILTEFGFNNRNTFFVSGEFRF